MCPRATKTVFSTAGAGPDLAPENGPGIAEEERLPHPVGVHSPHVRLESKPPSRPLGGELSATSRTTPPPPFPPFSGGQLAALGTPRSPVSTGIHFLGVGNGAHRGCPPADHTACVWQDRGALPPPADPGAAGDIPGVQRAQRLGAGSSPAGRPWRASPQLIPSINGRNVGLVGRQQQDTRNSRQRLAPRSWLRGEASPAFGELGSFHLQSPPSLFMAFGGFWLHQVLHERWGWPLGDVV